MDIKLMVSSHKGLFEKLIPFIFSHISRIFYVVQLKNLHRLKSRVFQFFGSALIVFFLGTNTLQAKMSEEIAILPTIKAPPLLQINSVGTSQFAVKNLSRKTLTFALMPQKNVTQDTAGILVCHHPFTLLPGQQCLLNLKIKGETAGQKITYGPLVCRATQKGRVKSDVSLCVEPTVKDSLKITFIAPKKAIIGVKPQALNIHAASFNPKTLTISNYSETVTARNITADLPGSWGDVKQNAKNCVKLQPLRSCKLFFTAKRAHSVEQIIVSGNNTTRVPVFIQVQPR